MAPSNSSSQDVEKSGLKQQDASVSSEPAGYDFSDIDEKKLVRKMDWFLLPWVSVQFKLTPT